MEPTIDSSTSKNHNPCETINNDSAEKMIPPNKLLNETKNDIDKTKLTANLSSTSLTATNSALLPAQVARVNLQPKPNSLGTSSCSATGNPRNKTALAPGHSLMDWIRLGSSGVDLTGFKGVHQVITLKELAKHNQRNDAWIAIRGVVYNITRYMDFHPGGVPELMKGVGTDATKIFDDVHAWVNYQSILQKCVIGQLSRSKINEIIPNLNSKTSILSKILPSTRGTAEKIPKPISTILEIKTDWKQTTNSISLWYKPIPEQYSLTFRLIYHSMTEFVINIHLPNGSIRHEYEMIDKIQWPPKYHKSFDTMQIEFCFKKQDKKLWNTYGSRVNGIEKKCIGRLYREWKVISNKKISESIHILVLKADQYMEIIPVGRHVEVKMNISGTEVSRYYTPVPSSFESNEESYDSDCICLIVKSYSDGALSPSLTAIQPEKYLTLSNCLGTFVIESFDDYKIINMIAAGTGITPMLGIIHRSLARRNVSSINLVNFNRDKKDIIYEEQLNRICLDTRVKVVHVLSQPKEPWEGKRGLISEDLIKEIIGVGTKQACVFTCGPVGFLSLTKGFLKNLGWNSSQMHEFNG